LTQFRSKRLKIWPGIQKSDRRFGPAIRSGRFGPGDSVNLGDSVESVELVEPVKLVESVKSVESVKLVDSVKSVESVKLVDSVKSHPIVQTNFNEV
jgi:hypothetical protein